MGMSTTKEIVGKTFISDMGIENEFYLSVGGLLLLNEELDADEENPVEFIAKAKNKKPIQRSSSLVEIKGKTLNVLPFEIIEGKQYVELRVIALLMDGVVSRTSSNSFIITKTNVIKVEDIEEIDGREMLCIEEKSVQDILGMTYSDKLGKYTLKV